MCGLRVPVCDAEHCEGGSKAVACYSCSLEIRYFGSGWDPRKSTHEPSTQDENLARETEKLFAVQICWGCFVAEVHSG